MKFILASFEGNQHVIYLPLHLYCRKVGRVLGLEFHINVWALNAHELTSFVRHPPTANVLRSTARRNSHSLLRILYQYWTFRNHDVRILPIPVRPSILPYNVFYRMLYVYSLVCDPRRMKSFCTLLLKLALD